jgi:1,4-dihydroxy-2-naphthoate octaprenyltransferase
MIRGWLQDLLTSLMLKKSTLQLLRFHFSIFLMPVYWFALSQVEKKDVFSAILIFIILHVLVYPSSNGYNSYMDRDESSIGGLKNPSQPTKQLFHISVLMDALALLLSFFVSLYFVVGIFAYILASRAYSFRGIRLKRYPLAGYLTVVVFQGAAIFFLVYHGCSANKTLHAPGLCLLASSFLIGGFYPLTQIYQHEADTKDNVKTISYLLGYRGTFIFCAIVYCAAFATLAFYFFNSAQQNVFFIFSIVMLPVIVYFLWWGAKVWNNVGEANFANTMRMNLVASTCTNIGFIVVLFMNSNTNNL